MYAISRHISRRLARQARSVQPRGSLSSNPSRNVRRLFSKRNGNIVEASRGQKAIEVVGPSGKPLKLSLLWLRDHCHCKSCVNQDTMQRSFDTFSLSYDQGAKVETGNEGLKVKWNDGHYSTYSWEWLVVHQHETPPKIKHTFWGSEIKKQPPSVHYDEIMTSDAGVGKWTSKILEYGFCFVDGCPISPENTEKLLERIAFIRITHYGGFYDFTSDLTMKDTAYTSLALPAHTDNTYFTDPSGLQAFHLLSHTSGSGGTSLLVDGFHCANLLHKTSPEAFKILSEVPVRWHASGNEGIIITPATKFPVLNLGENGELTQLRWNHDDRATMPLNLDPSTNVKIEDWYEAARLLNSIIKDTKNEYWEQLRPGRPLIFNNWRVMHGRSAFTGKRRMCGAYINRDDFMSRYWNTNFSRDDVLKLII